MVVPFTQPPDDDESHAAPLRRIAQMDKSVSMDGGGSRQSFDPDGADFTMVLPNLRSQPFDQRPMSSDGPRTSITPRQSPRKYSSGSHIPTPSSRLRSPQTHSQHTAAVLTEADAHAGADVQIYEDPFSDQPVDGNVGPAKPVLEELPINERSNERAETPDITRAPNLSRSTRSNEQNIAIDSNAPATQSRTPRKPNGEATASSRPDAETLRSRRLLSSGIERIRAKTLDAHGFRRVQDLIKTGGDIWGEENGRYGELLLALLDYLETPNAQLKAVAKGNTQNLKTQVLAAVRGMVMLYRAEAEPYAARALCGILAARRWERDSEHLAQEMERACEGIVGMMDPEEGIAAVVDVVEALATPQSPSSTGSSSGGEPVSPPASADGDGARNGRTVVLSLEVLDQLLREARRKGVEVPPPMTQRLGQLAVRFLHDGDADVRRADLEFCLGLHERFGGEGFWKAVVGVKEMHLNLITYYLARRGKA
jgi:CLIP-associating protein 1/2